MRKFQDAARRLHGSVQIKRYDSVKTAEMSNAVVCSLFSVSILFIVVTDVVPSVVWGLLVYISVDKPSPRVELSLPEKQKPVFP